MDTILKYAFYLVIILIVYLVVAGLYGGKITDVSTVGEVGKEVTEGAKRVSEKAEKMVVDTYKEVKDDVEPDDETRVKKFIKPIDTINKPANDNAKKLPEAKKMPSEG